jgi:hypothetical protein
MSAPPPEKPIQILEPPEKPSQTENQQAGVKELHQTQESKKVLWKLIIVSDLGTGESYKLDGQVNVGRSPDNNITLREDAAVSDHHAIFQIRQNTLEVFDLNSDEGIYVNNNVIQQTTQLKAGDLVQIGKTIFVVQQS